MARSPDNHLNVVNVGIRSTSFQQFIKQNLHTAVAQYYGIVQDGLLNARHAFRGLKRPLMLEGDMQADKSVIVYSWRPEFDYVWSRGQFSGNPTPTPPPPKRVFVVLVREEKQPNDYPEVGTVFGSVERWNWIAEDPDSPHAPMEWSERYTEKLWSRML